MKTSCSIPEHCIDARRLPLFIARGASGGVRCCLRQAASVTRAWCSEGNRVSFRSSSRNGQLKLSIKAFWVGLPGAM